MKYRGLYIDTAKLPEQISQFTVEENNGLVTGKFDNSDSLYSCLFVDSFYNEYFPQFCVNCFLSSELRRVDFKNVRQISLDYPEQTHQWDAQRGMSVEKARPSADREVMSVLGGTHIDKGVV